MVAVVTIRDVPDEVRDVLSQEARERGQSLQAFLLSVLRRQAAFSRNRQLLTEIESDLSRDAGAQSDAPDAGQVLAQEHAGATSGTGGTAGDERASA
jgi:hypothetical protein